MVRYHFGLDAYFQLERVLMLMPSSEVQQVWALRRLSWCCDGLLSSLQKALYGKFAGPTMNMSVLK